jgi:hypothetical protein
MQTSALLPEVLCTIVTLRATINLGINPLNLEVHIFVNFVACIASFNGAPEHTSSAFAFDQSLVGMTIQTS